MTMFIYNSRIHVQDGNPDNWIRVFPINGGANIFTSSKAPTSSIISYSGFYNGNVYVSDGYNGYISICTYNNLALFSSSRQYTVNPHNGSNGNGPKGMAFDMNGNIYITNNYGGTGANVQNTVGVYYASNLVAINANLITGLSSPLGIAIDQNFIYVCNIYNSTIGKYNYPDGSVVNANFITSLSSPRYLKIYGNYIYVSNFTTGTIGVYYKNTGTPYNSTFITGLSSPTGLDINGVYLYVINAGSKSVNRYQLN